MLVAAELRLKVAVLGVTVVVVQFQICELPISEPATQPAEHVGDVGAGPGGVGGFTEVIALVVLLETEAAGRGFEPDVSVLVAFKSTEVRLFDLSWYLTKSGPILSEPAVLVLVAVKEPLRVPFVNNLTSISFGIKPVGAIAHTEAKFVALNPSEFKFVEAGVEGRTAPGLVIGTGPVMMAWAGLMPVNTAPVAAAKKTALRLENLDMTFGEVNVCVTTIPDTLLKGAAQAAIGCNVRVRWRKRGLSPGKPGLFHQCR